MKPSLHRCSFWVFGTPFPAPSSRRYSVCSEKSDSVEGIRYKILSYPTIREIAHAVSIDEKRSEFSPVFVCPPIDPARTIVHQTWFAGAHADVGGGYGDSNDLAGVSLNWILGLLEKYDLFNGNKPRVYADPAGLAHASICDFPANLGSDYEDRGIPQDAVLHASVGEQGAEQCGAAQKRWQSDLRGLSRQREDFGFREARLLSDALKNLTEKGSAPFDHY